MLLHTHSKTTTIIKGRGKKHWEEMYLFMALMVVMASQVYTYPQTHQVIYI